MKIKSAEFIISNSDVTKCPKSRLPEYAFIGRSNVGKSSLINMLTSRKSLAKTSGRPGKNAANKSFFNKQKLAPSRFTRLWLCTCFKKFKKSISKIHNTIFWLARTTGYCICTGGY